jgi:hypothetical protein
VQSTSARIRQRFSDAEIVRRAEFIVIARVAPDSIHFVDHPATSLQGRWWEHRAILKITRVIKGDVLEHDLPVIIHYGLDPITGGFMNDSRGFLNARFFKPNYSENVVELFDTGNSVRSFEPISGDIRADQIWLLRHLRPSIERRDSTDAPGIWDPEDIQPIRRETDLRKYLILERPNQAMRPPTLGRCVLMLTLASILDMQLCAPARVVADLGASNALLRKENL